MKKIKVTRAEIAACKSFAELEHLEFQRGLRKGFAFHVWQGRQRKQGGFYGL